MPSRGMNRRSFLRRTACGVLLAEAAIAAPGSDDSPAEAADLDLGAMLRPVPKRAKFIDPDWHIWGGSMARTPDGVCHLLYARWPRKLGHFAWLSHSEIAHATAPHPLGPYTFASVALPGKQGPEWVTSTAHNPTVIFARGKYYLYFSSARVEGQIPESGPTSKAPYWEPTRETQRIGVAYADHLAGAWARVDKPLIDATPGSFDALMTSNPSVTEAPDGSFLMLYKCMDADMKVFHGVAVSDHPLGPFKKDPAPVFTHETSKFPAEDPFLWYQDDRFYAILKDMQANYSSQPRSLVLFESRDGHAWKSAAHPLVNTRSLRCEDGNTQELARLERPQLYRENGRPAVLFCAAAESLDHSYNVHIPLKQL